MNNMFNDDITKSIASAVRDVLEGKPAVIKEEMDPTDHVKKSDAGKFCVYNPAGKKVAEFDTKPEADKYAIDNHKKIMAKEVAQPQKPSGKLGQDSGEKAFADKHKGKKVGEKEDGTVVKEETLLEALNERKLLKVAKDLEKSVKKTGDLVREITKHEELEMIDGEFSESYGELGKGQDMMDYGIKYLESDIKDYFKKQESKNESVNEMTISIGERLNKSGNATVDVDYIGSNDYSKKLEKSFKIKIKSTGNTTADITGPRKNIIALLKSNAYLMDEDEIAETFPELEEAVKEAVKPELDEAEAQKLKESEKQKAYQKFFNSALKKFGVDSPADLDAEKKKEFFNHIDKNYKAKAEEIDAAGKDDEDVNEALSAKDMEKRLKLIKKAVEKINRNNLRNAKSDAMKMMKDSGMFDEDASDDEEVDEITDKQKKLPAGLQKAIKAKEKEEVKEGTLKVSMYAGPDAGGDDPKKMGLKVKKTGETSMGDNVEISGPDAKLVKFAQNNLGVSGRNLRAVQKELDDM